MKLNTKWVRVRRGSKGENYRHLQDIIYKFPPSPLCDNDFVKITKIGVSFENLVGKQQNSKQV
jgi:hypothetical protein